jgi:thymidylate kinase
MPFKKILTKGGIMKGRFIVCEGLDAAGKTTVIKEALKKMGKSYAYNKGLTSDTLIGKIAPKMPSTLTFLVELMYSTKKKVMPFMEEGKTVLQDRYDMSIISYVPEAERWYNRAFAKILKRFLLKPDMLIYFTVSKSERIKRLKNQAYNKYHYKLINNPELIDLREREYSELYENFKGEKYKIDTTKENLEITVNRFISKILI